MQSAASKIALIALGMAAAQIHGHCVKVPRINRRTWLKNKVNEKTGSFICGGIYDKGCGCDIKLGHIIKDVVYCAKCARKLKEAK